MTVQLPNVIFVTGASRSGTTLVSRIVARNEKVAWLREQHYFGDIVPVDSAQQVLSAGQATQTVAWISARYREDLWNARIETCDRTFAQQLVKQLPATDLTAYNLFLRATTALTSTTSPHIPCEQTPRNIFYAHNLLEAYPEARIIHVVRDPRAVLASQKNRWAMRANGNDGVPLSETVRVRMNYHPFTVTRLWNSANAKAQELKQHPRFCIVRFEDLTSDPQTTIRRVCQFLHLEYSAQMLDVPQWGFLSPDKCRTK